MLSIFTYIGDIDGHVYHLTITVSDRYTKQNNNLKTLSCERHSSIQSVIALMQKLVISNLIVNFMNFVLLTITQLVFNRLVAPSL